MAVNDLYRVEIYHNVGSELTMNVCHMRETVSEDDPALAALNVQGFVQDLYLLWAELLSEDWRVTVIKVRRVSPAAGIPYTTVYGGAEAIEGTVESEIVPSQAAILVSLYSDTGDRTGRGRQYIPGCAESIQNEGLLSETAYIASAGAIELFYAAEHGPGAGPSTGKYRFNIWSSPAAPNGDHDVKHAFIHPNLATQRRRRNFPGFSSL